MKCEYMGILMVINLFTNIYTHTHTQKYDNDGNNNNKRKSLMKQYFKALKEKKEDYTNLYFAK